jgi:flagellar basal-body rod protein FlgB
MPGIQQFDPTMKLLQKVLDLRSKNQEIIGSNIANAETPGYSAQSFTFEDQLKSALSENSPPQMATQPNHIPISPGSLEQVTGKLSTTRDATEIGDKNNVSVDQEMIKLSQNEILYETAVSMLNKKLSMLKYAANNGS